MNNIDIRLASKIDADFIKEIHKEAKSEIGSFNLFYSWDNYLQNKTPYKFYIFSDAGVDVGFMRFGFSEKIGFNIVKEVGILKKFRGRGYGKKMLNRMPRPIYLTCNDDNEVGNHFYKSCGMRNIGKKKTKTGKWTLVWVIN